MKNITFSNRMQRLNWINDLCYLVLTRYNIFKADYASHIRLNFWTKSVRWPNEFSIFDQFFWDTISENVLLSSALGLYFISGAFVEQS